MSAMFYIRNDGPDIGEVRVGGRRVLLRPGEEIRQVVSRGAMEVTRLDDYHEAQPAEPACRHYED